MRFSRSLPVVVAILGLAVAGCGSKSKSTASSTSTPTQTATTPKSTPAPAPPAKPSANIAASLAEYTIKPSPAVGKAGTVTFQVTNNGQRVHEFVVVKTPKPAGSLLKGSEADETGKVGEVADLPPGASKPLKLRLTPGHYALLCNLPGHYVAGQHTDLTVR
jgi:uncharacterized cupredoxin-like copper-binding protein